MAGVLVALAALTLGQPAEPARRAVIVGVNAYARAQPLRFAAADAAALADLLRPAGYAVELLTDDAPDAAHKPTQENVESALRRALRASDRGDTVLVSLSGHGRQFDGRPYFCPSDGDPAKPASMVSLDALYANLEGTHAAAKLLFVDACRDDPKGGVTQLATKMPCGLAVLLGCSSGEVSAEFDALGHGLFFHVLLTGLRGEARTPLTGAVTFNSLAEYVAHRIGPAAAGLKPGYVQTPHTQYSYCGLSPVLVPGEAGWAAAQPMPASVGPPRADVPQRMPAADQRVEAARLYRRGLDAKFGRNGQVYNRQAAAGLFRQSADLGDALGMVMLAQTARDQGQPETAAAWLNQASAVDSPGGRYALALAHADGVAGKAKDATRAVALLEQAAGEGCMEAAADLAFRLWQGTGVTADPRRAVELLRPAVAADYPCGLLTLGQMTRTGAGLPADKDAGVKLVQRSAAGGCETGMRELAKLMGDGTVPGPPATVKSLLAQAASRGDADAANRYAVVLFTGWPNGQPDYPSAVRYFRQAAEKGDGWAMRNLGAMHRDGRGLPADIPKAKFWLGRAAAVGVPDAAAERAALGP